jgi:putative ABC transport system permease protein
VRLSGVPFHVIGVQAPYVGERVRSIYVPFQTARMVLPAIGVKPAPTLYLKARSIEEVPLVEARSGDLLSQRLGRWERQVKLDTSEARLAQVRGAFSIFKLFLGAITGISLVVGGIGIMNVLVASISERTREIGVRVALGARRRDIVTQFLDRYVVLRRWLGSSSLANGVTSNRPVSASSISSSRHTEQR